MKETNTNDFVLGLLLVETSPGLESNKASVVSEGSRFLKELSHVLGGFSTQSLLTALHANAVEFIGLLGAVDGDRVDLLALLSGHDDVHNSGRSVSSPLLTATLGGAVFICSSVRCIFSGSTRLSDVGAKRHVVVLIFFSSSKFLEGEFRHANALHQLFDISFVLHKSFN